MSESYDPRKNPPLTESEIISLNSDGVFAARIQGILDKQIAILTGSHETECALIVFPSVGMKQLEMKGDFDEVVGTTVRYLVEQLPPNLVDGVTVVINGRNVQSNVSKHLLERITSIFPVAVKTVYLMKTPGLLGIKKTVVSDSIAKKLNLVYVYEPTGMVKHLPLRDLPTECGGELQYDHKQWILFKLAQERMGYYLKETSKRVEELLSPMREKVSVSCYDDVEVVLCQHLDLKESIMTEFNETRDVVQRFLDHLHKEDYVHPTVMATQQYVAMVTSLKSHLESLSHDEALFETFWDHHKAILDHKIYLGDFLRSVEKVKDMLEAYVADLNADTTLGKRIEEAMEIGQRHETFVSQVKEKVDGHLHRLQDEGKHLRQPLTLSSLEVIENPYIEDTVAHIERSLTEVSKQYEMVMKTCQQKRDLYIVYVKYFMAGSECEGWLKRASRFLGKDRFHEGSTESISTAISELDAVQQEEPVSTVNSLKQIATCLTDKTCRKGANKVINKCQKVHDKLEDKRHQLLEELAASFQPPPLPPSDIMPTVVTPPEVFPISPHPSSPTSTTDQYRPPLSSPDSSDTVSSRSDDHMDGPLVTMTTSSWKSRKFVYNELVATEQDYIHDLRSIMHGYYDDMSPDNNRVPVKLRGKRPVIFGNLHKIQKFHRDVFFEELQKHSDHPERVGEAFLHHGDGFSLYEDYCKNKPESDQLLNCVTPTEEVYFQEIQQNLGHQLPLSSYLLKPVQRITKYQLLLKDLIRHTTETDLEDTRESLMSALEKMLNILKYLNNSMKVVGLKGFPGSLMDQGRLLIQDVLQVTEIATKGVSRKNIFPKGAKRHVFLFEKVVVFSKYTETNSGQDGRQYTQGSYMYKSHIPLDDLSLRDKVDGQPSELDLGWHSQQKLFRLVAPNKEVKDLWSGEIRRLLEEQLKQARNLAASNKRLLKVVDTQPAGDSSSGLSIERIGGTLRASIRRKEKRTSHISQGTSEASPSTLTRSVRSQSTSVEQSFNGSTELTRSDSTGSFETDDDLDSSTDAMYETLAPGANKDYIAINSYTPGSTESDIGLVEGQQVEVVGVNPYGWWWVRATEPEHHTVVEGWVPAGYLQPVAAYS